MKKISFVVNGLLKNINSIRSEIENQFSDEFDLSFLISPRSSESITLAEQSLSNGADYIIAIGGDGTINEVINGVMKAPKEKRNDLIVGLLPTGSGNDFAKTMKLSSNVSDLKKMIQKNHYRVIDLGEIKCKDFNNKDITRYFNNIADVGLGGEVVAILNRSKKIFGPTFRYFKASIQAFFSYKKKRIKIVSKEFVWEGAVLILCLANAAYFGSGLGIAPHAKVDDGKIAVVIAGDISLFDYLKNLPKIRRQEFIDHPGLSYHEVESCTIEPIDDGLLLETDGELAGTLPLSMTVLKKELKFLSPVNIPLKIS